MCHGMNQNAANIRKSVSRERGGNMDRDTKHFAIVAAIVGILLTLVMLYYANKSDKLVDDYAKGNLTLNVEKTGWQQKRDEQGNIYYTQGNYELRAK